MTTTEPITVGGPGPGKPRPDVEEMANAISRVLVAASDAALQVQVWWHEVGEGGLDNLDEAAVRVALALYCR
jgi:hypothetical protein